VYVTNKKAGHISDTIKHLSAIKNKHFLEKEVGMESKEASRQTYQ